MIGLDLMGADDVNRIASSDSRRIAAVAAMKRYENERVFYKWNGKDPATGLDCSGAVMAAWSEAGIVSEGERGRWSSKDLHRSLPSVSRGDLLPGDLVFYGSLLGGVSHVMMYEGGGRVIGATGGGPKTKTRADAEARDARVKSLPIDYRKDLRGCGRAPVNEPLKRASGAARAVTYLAVAIGLAGLGGAGWWILRGRRVSGMI